MYTLFFLTSLPFFLTSALPFIWFANHSQTNPHSSFPQFILFFCNSNIYSAWCFRPLEEIISQMANQPFVLWEAPKASSSPWVQFSFTDGLADHWQQTKRRVLLTKLSFRIFLQAGSIEMEIGSRGIASWFSSEKSRWFQRQVRTTGTWVRDIATTSSFSKMTKSLIWLSISCLCCMNGMGWFISRGMVTSLCDRVHKHEYSLLSFFSSLYLKK